MSDPHVPESLKHLVESNWHEGYTLIMQIGMAEFAAQMLVEQEKKIGELQEQIADLKFELDTF
ncbi:MAG: hypothetical protein JKY33_10835 [Bacteroidia bacterium]|nr:hypothetical protein [Bacteroidia bacterium]